MKSASMTILLLALTTIASLCTTTTAFAPPPPAVVGHGVAVLTTASTTAPFTHRWMESNGYNNEYNQGGDDEHDNEPSLILGGDEMQQQMQQLRSKYPTSEADYLAAARARAKTKPPSQSIQATTEDFAKVAEEKKKQLGIENFDQSDWEESAKEAGNADSQILLPQLPDEGDDEDGNPPQEPTLLL